EPITVSTLHSNFDTVLAVYEVEGGQLLKCNDDIQPRDPTREELESRVSSEVRINTIAGRAYAVQVGGCFPQEACYKTTSGSITLRVSSPPGNDDRSSAAPIAAGAPVTVTNTGATEEPGETLSCAGHLYGKTVWFRYTALAVGTVAFSAAGFDTVLAVYRGSSITPLGCNDDAIDGQTGGSRIPTIQPAGAPIEVTPGDYLIQVGGYYDKGFDIVAARNGPFAVQVEFTPDTDLDNDGVNSALDCDEVNSSVRPGAPEVENNDLDEDCNGEKAYDQDADGFRRGVDCRDDLSAINPGAREIRGNRIDENCDTRTPDLRPLGAKVVLEGRHFDGRDPHTWVRAFSISDIPAGTLVKISCRGDGCPFKKKRHLVKQGRGTLVLRAGFRVEVGTVLSLVMTRPETIGLRQDFRIRRAKRPVPTSHCLDPRGHRRPCRRL
ncbi:MAG TPA: putative metal-binding motif-containing protein, partial [Solirubrobacterales bacterium]|nr:putative metal-binding motif-containing protein [Solirubrobacterales bacterium]